MLTLRHSRNVHKRMKLVMICFHNVNICGEARGAHVKGAGSGIDLAGRGCGRGGRVLRRLAYVRAQRV